MGYGEIGMPSTEVKLSLETITKVLDMSLGDWLYKMNLENYSSRVFPLSLEKYSEKRTFWGFDESNEVFLQRKQEKNLFVSWELKVVEGSKKWMKRVFEFIDFEYQDFPSVGIYLSGYPNEEVKQLLGREMKGKRYLLPGSMNLNTADIFYCLYHAYIELCKITTFLEDQYDHNIPLPNFERPNGGKTFDRVWQAVLYYSVLQKCQKIKSFTKKEIPELVKTMYLPTGKRISKNTFYQKYLIIDSIKRKRERNEVVESYSGEDYYAVYAMLEKEHPEALSIMEEHYFRNDLI